MTYLSVFFKVFHFTCGIVPNGDIDSRKMITLFVSVYIVLLMGEVIAFIYATKDIYRFEIAYQILCFMYIGVVQGLSWMHRKSLVSICNRLQGQLPEFMGDDATQQIEVNFKKIINAFAIIYLFSMPIYMIPPFINFFYKNMDYNDPLSYIMPYWFGIIKVESVWEYLLMNVVQNILAVSSFSAYSCSFGFIICNMVSVKAHLDEIEKRFRALGDKMNAFHDDEFKIRHIEEYSENAIRSIHARYEEILVEDLLKIIRYKQVYFRLCKDISKYYQRMFSVAVCWFIFVCVLTLFMTTQIVSDIVFKMKQMAVIANSVFSFFFYCYFAESISHINEKCMRSFYDIPWYYNFVKFRKPLLMLLLHNQVDIEIKAFNMYTMNLTLFSRALRVIYSCLNVLLMMQRKGT